MSDRWIGAVLLLASAAGFAYLARKQTTEIHLQCSRESDSCVLEESNLFQASRETFTVTDFRGVEYGDAYSIVVGGTGDPRREHVDLRFLHGAPGEGHDFRADPLEGDMLTGTVNEFLGGGSAAMFGPPPVLDARAHGERPSSFGWVLALGALAFSVFVMVAGGKKKPARP